METDAEFGSVQPAGVAGWVERGLIALGLVLALWSLLAAAQLRFYASLPVPSVVARPTLLPGEDHIGAADSHPAPKVGAVAPGTWVAKLEAPSVGLTATVIEGSTEEMLARAAGHIEATAFPGDPGNVGIAGHRDTTFRALRKLHEGDTLRLTTTTGAYDYRVQRLLVVNPEDVYVLAPTDRPSLTLVTCYPFTFIGHAPQRFIVRAEQTVGDNQRRSR